ncbi:chromosomal passenger protein putative (CPC2) [Leptomonas pyrrhocoris]|uniref:Chromosomal passenger protein putative (CPC2) n=1 Tax=Leptomonas pyrrhocoris TaxID=157538 RepID=A0A0N0VH52_LEPPY|nr:chromosomal passenger protein putative (CPC2) [Leptomonas pyrrhocoris]KPA84714.1 chromosomal passenger protein putative (CPC2) [Leptomonas pyrrhocoris]|eukprot:XP_015663153.1 chromosomal passenger protein putative (CPC2) [Leptomonas pyrrhocoris]
MMPTYRNDVDPFKDIRVLPREAAQLRHHLSRIHHTLQKKYFVSPELSEFALQPDKSDEFIAHYKEEIQRIFAKLNKSARHLYSVNVDPLRLTTGFEFHRVDDGRANENAVRVSQSFSSPDAEAKWTASMVETGRQLAQQQAIESNRLALSAAVQSTPSSQQTQNLRAGAVAGGGGVGGMAGGASTGVVDSEVRKVNKESFLFSTPPEFKGFAPSGASPSETLTPA